MRYLSFFSVLVCLLTLTACYEDPKDVTLHHQGQYKGQADNLPPAEQRTAQLAARFKMVQADR
ncbi:hypothetical protein BegalDRAFT_0490 [Beggiatoa alba B18LD]|uniref:Lipoprotein n=1 Tax=Beggiatoa alba B18LD TaxID=395493 RepID=I3CCR5_9GAMM|nr:hypothetical protein [Beggiatoa alba]EIJ41408.1 hypothetical protein BegalDRAFT_0490 [Beggiatoa alba B18LD]